MSFSWWQRGTIGLASATNSLKRKPFKVLSTSVRQKEAWSIASLVIGKILPFEGKALRLIGPESYQPPHAAAACPRRICRRSTWRHQCLRGEPAGLRRRARCQESQPRHWIRCCRINRARALNDAHRLASLRGPLQCRWSVNEHAGGVLQRKGLGFSKENRHKEDWEWEGNCGNGNMLIIDLRYLPETINTPWFLCL